MEHSNLTTKTYKHLWAMLIYFILCFYYFGVIMLTYFLSYPSLSHIRENTKSVMDSFSSNMVTVCYIPAGLLIFSAIILLWFTKHIFPKWILIISVLLTLLSAGTTLFLIAPLHYSLPVTGFTVATKTKLLSLSFYFQIIPALFQVLLALILLNDYFRKTRFLSRWLFILVFSLSLYNAGTGFMDIFVNYFHWGLIGKADWLAYRFSENKFLQVFLIPNILPFVLIISLFQYRPKEMPKSLLWINWLAVLAFVISSAFYFVPVIQFSLNKEFSPDLIADLIKYSFLLWLPGILMAGFAASSMLLVMFRHNLNNR